MPNPANNAANVDAILAGLFQEVADFQAARNAGMPKPTYGRDGQSVSWDEWYNGKLTQIKEIQQMKQWVSGPPVIFTRARG